jgi:hypothetical protein
VEMTRCLHISKKGGFMKVLCTVVLLSSMLFGQILYEEHFTGGAMQLDWHPWFYDTLTGIGDSMRVLSDATAPGGDNWAGVVSNENMGAAGLTYAGDAGMTDYSVEAWIHTTVTTGTGGPYNGITMRMDSATDYYYRLVSDFDSNNRLQLGAFTGGMGAVILRNWTSGEIPGGVPSSSSWHKLKMMMVADSVWCWYDDVLLPDCPIEDTVHATTQGFFGVYVFNMMFADSTKCDDIVAAAAVGIEEHTSGTANVSSISVHPNPFRSTTSIAFSIAYSAESMGLRIYDAAGRTVKSFDRSLIIEGQGSIVWDGRDEKGNAVAPGVYFITGGARTQMMKVVKLR